MSGLIYDEQSLVDNQLKQYDKFLHSRINKYTGTGRTLVTYYSINESQTSSSVGMETLYQTLGPDSPLRFDKIKNMCLFGVPQFSAEDTQASSTQVRNYNVSGECVIIPGTVMPKENDMFIMNHVKMNHIFRVTNVLQDGLIQDGGYKISYTLLSTNIQEIEWADKQSINTYIMDLQTVGSEDLTPVISENDYEKRSRLISMLNEMIENYKARYYDRKHNCFLLHLNGETLFDPCANMFMARNGTMIIDNAFGNVVLNENKLRYFDMEMEYQRSPFKWLERECPLRYTDTFKYRTVDAKEFFPDSSFALYGEDIQVMVYGDSWCASKTCEYFFPIEIERIFENRCDIRDCSHVDSCECCDNYHKCCCRKGYHMERYDYVSIIHDYVHGLLTNIDKLSLLTGDQMFDNAMATQIYLWTPFIIHIIKQTLKIK